MFFSTSIWRAPLKARRGPDSRNGGREFARRLGGYVRHIGMDKFELSRTCSIPTSWAAAIIRDGSCPLWVEIRVLKGLMKGRSVIMAFEPPC